MIKQPLRDLSLFLTSLYQRFKRPTVYLGNHRAITRTVFGHKLIVDTRDVSLAPHILLDGYWEREVTRVFRNLVHPGMTVVEVGANVGYFSVLAAEGVGSNGNFFAFEANPALADVTFRNLDLNGLLKQSTVIDKAVYSESTELEFNIYNQYLGSSSLWAEPEHVALFRDEIRKLNVDAVSLDDYFPPGTRIDLIKIDAEGAEPHIIRGATRLLTENSEVKIIMEYAPAMITSSCGSLESFHQTLMDLGFTVFRISKRATIIPTTFAQLSTETHCELLVQR